MSQKHLIFTLFLIVFCIASEPARKQLAGLPSFFSRHHIPEPVLHHEHSAILKAKLVEGEESLLNPQYKKLIYETEIPVDAEAPLQITFASPLEKRVKLSLRTPSGKHIRLERYRHKENFPVGDSGLSVPVSTYLINDIKETGFYVLTVESHHHLHPEERKRLLSESHQAILIIYNYDDIEIETSLNSYVLKVGHEIGLHAQILKGGESALTYKDGEIVIDKAEMLIELPSGTEEDIPMHDDGLKGDKLKGDHIYTATVTTSSSGVYHLSAVLKGFVTINGQKKPFLKSAEHTIVVSSPNVEIGDDAWVSKTDNENRVNINVALNFDSNIRETQNLGSFRAYTEVYGVSSDGTVQPAAWIGSIVDVQDANSVPFFSLEFDLNWLTHSNLKGPLTIKNTYLADAGTQYPVTTHDDTINVRNSLVQYDPLFKNVFSVRGPITITKEMKFGVNPLKDIRVNASAPSLILVHGYCSESNPWQRNANYFTDAAYFLKAKSNFNNHEFALSIHNFATSLGSNVYSLIGHSQGGMASLHLLNNFWTGLDKIEGKERLIQTLGTPWQGNTIAGSAANVAKVFGIGCGASNDLTTDGAKNWLTGIHEDHPERVYFYTTTYKRGNWFLAYCNVAVNALLTWPNDGTAELDKSSLPGGNDMGTTESQCHTTGMKYPPQYDDNNRNSIMNKNAARV